MVYAYSTVKGVFFCHRPVQRHYSEQQQNLNLRLGGGQTALVLSVIVNINVSQKVQSALTAY